MIPDKCIVLSNLYINLFDTFMNWFLQELQISNTIGQNSHVKIGIILCQCYLYMFLLIYILHLAYLFWIMSIWTNKKSIFYEEKDYFLTTKKKKKKVVKSSFCNFSKSTLEFWIKPIYRVIYYVSDYMFLIWINLDC